MRTFGLILLTILGLVTLPAQVALIPSVGEEGANEWHLPRDRDAYNLSFLRSNTFRIMRRASSSERDRAIWMFPTFWTAEIKPETFAMVRSDPEFIDLQREFARILADRLLSAPDKALAHLHRIGAETERWQLLTRGIDLVTQFDRTYARLVIAKIEDPAGRQAAEAGLLQGWITSDPSSLLEDVLTRQGQDLEEGQVHARLLMLPAELVWPELDRIQDPVTREDVRGIVTLRLVRQDVAFLEVVMARCETWSYYLREARRMVMACSLRDPAYALNWLLQADPETQLGPPPAADGGRDWTSLRRWLARFLVVSLARQDLAAAHQAVERIEDVTLRDDLKAVLTSEPPSPR